MPYLQDSGQNSFFNIPRLGHVIGQTQGDPCEKKSDLSEQPGARSSLFSESNIVLRKMPAPPALPVL